MTVPWIEVSGLPVEFDDPLTLHFISVDDNDDWGEQKDWDRLHAEFQQHGVPYRVVVSDQLPPPEENPYEPDQTALQSIAFCNPSLSRT